MHGGSEYSGCCVQTAIVFSVYVHNTIAYFNGISCMFMEDNPCIGTHGIACFIAPYTEVYACNTDLVCVNAFHEAVLFRRDGTGICAAPHAARRCKTFRISALQCDIFQKELFRLTAADSFLSFLHTLFLGSRFSAEYKHPSCQLHGELGYISRAGAV